MKRGSLKLGEVPPYPALLEAVKKAVNFRGCLDFYDGCLWNVAFEGIAYRLMEKGWSTLKAVKIAFVNSILLHVVVTLVIWVSFMLMCPVFLIPLLHILILSIVVCLIIA